MKKAIILFIFLTGCGSNIQTRFIGTQTWPELPDLEAPITADIRPFSFNLPGNSQTPFLCIDQDNFEALNELLITLRTRESMWQARLAEINRQRREWRELNQRNNTQRQQQQSN
jgi:hypothetical protein